MRESWKPQRGSKLHLVGELARCLIPDNFTLPAEESLVFPHSEGSPSKRFRTGKTKEGSGQRIESERMGRYDACTHYPVGASKVCDPIGERVGVLGLVGRSPLFPAPA